MNHYEVLGVSPTASDAEVRAAFRAIVRTHHPDANPDLTALSDTEIVAKAAYWVAAQASYEELKTPERRAAYDAKLTLTLGKCPSCKGTGVYQLKSGWKLIESPCTVCKGTGKKVL